MAFLNSMDISVSAMTAQRVRMDTAALNIANQETTRTENGEPYRRKMVVFQAVDNNDFKNILKRKIEKRDGQSGGVIVSKIVEDEREFKLVYDPTHPDANEMGYVSYPNVDVVKETIDTMSATRSYEANITAFNAVKQMASKALEIGK